MQKKIFTRLVGQKCLVDRIFVRIFANKLFMFMKMEKKIVLLLMVMLAISAIVNSETQNVNTIFGNAEIANDFTEVSINTGIQV